MTNDNDGLSKGKNINFLRFLRENTFFLLKNLMNPDKIRCVIIHGFGGALSLKNRILFRGILPALVSPLSEDGNVMVKETEKLVRWQLSQGVNGFYVCGSTGEGLLLEKKTREKLLEVVLDAVEGKSGLEITAEDGRNASEFVSAFYMSAALKRTVNFPLSPSDPVFTLRGLVETMPRFGRKTISTKNAGGPISFGTGS